VGKGVGRAGGMGGGWLAAALALALALAGCAAPPATPPATPPDAPHDGATRTDAAPPATTLPMRHESLLVLGAERVSAEWHLPPPAAGAPRGLVTLQHGFMRQCHHLRGTAAAIARTGLATLCLNTTVTGGNPALAGSLADALAAGQIRLPDGREPPGRIVVAGFSAGAHFAVVLGARLAEVAPARVVGAVLLDPVAGRAFEPALERLSGRGERPVLSLAAKSDGCNARHNAHPALRRMAEAARAAGREDFAGVVFGERSTHMDAEGEDTDWLAFLACGRLWPDASIVSALRNLAAAWSIDLIEGRRSGPAWPGGAMLEASLRPGTVQLLR
jgi:hypothetical protein